MGHSFGGTITQLLLDRGLGAPASSIDSAPTEGVAGQPAVARLKSLFPVLKNPANRHRAVGFTPRSSTTRSPTPSARRTPTGLRALPHPRARHRRVGVRPVRQLQARPSGHLGQLRQRRPGAAAVHRRRRGPHHAAVGATSRTPSTTRSATLTEYHEFPGRAHWTCRRRGWEEVADYALDWAVAHVHRPAATATCSALRRSARVGMTESASPTSAARPRWSSSTAGGSSPTRPSTRPAGATASAGGRRPARPPARRSTPADLGPVDAVLLSHDHHADNLDDAGRALLPGARTVV